MKAPAVVLFLITLLFYADQTSLAAQVPTLEQRDKIRQEMITSLHRLNGDLIMRAGHLSPLIDSSKGGVITTSTTDSRTRYHQKEEALRRGNGVIELDKFNDQTSWLMGQPESVPGFLLARFDYAHQAKIKTGGSSQRRTYDIAPGGVVLYVAIGQNARGTKEANYIKLADLGKDHLGSVMLILNHNPTDREEVKTLKERLVPIYEAEMSRLQKRVEKILGSTH